MGSCFVRRKGATQKYKDVTMIDPDSSISPPAALFGANFGHHSGGPSINMDRMWSVDNNNNNNKMKFIPFQPKPNIITIHVIWQRLQRPDRFIISQNARPEVIEKGRADRA